MAVVIDTSALVEWERSNWEAATSEISGDAEIIVPAIVWAEALAGVRLADTGERAARRRARLEAIRAITGIEPFTAEIAEFHADIFAELHRLGTMIPQNDIAVAATARSAGAIVLVGPEDEEHFRRVDGLEVALAR